jgi:hypothetical protein
VKETLNPKGNCQRGEDAQYSDHCASLTNYLSEALFVAPNPEFHEASTTTDCCRIRDFQVWPCVSLGSPA